MPIRSPHGRSAAYRALWQWPLRSPARLALTAIGVLAVLVAATIGIGMTNGSVALPRPRGKMLVPTFRPSSLKGEPVGR